jgi:hypothetical protein
MLKRIVWQKEWLLLFAALIFCDILCEVTLLNFKRFRPFPYCFVGEHENRPSKYFVADSVIGWKMRPRVKFSWNGAEFHSTYVSNTSGFRASSDFDPFETRKKIVVVGDSFTFGTGIQYEDTYGARIESDLPGSVVYNLAMPGFGLDQVWLTLRNKGLPLKPDLVIVGLVSVDFRRSLTAYRLQEGFNKPAFKLVNGQLVRKTAADRPNSFIHFLENHSRVWTLFKEFTRWIGTYIPFGEWWHLNEAILDAIQSDCRINQTPVLFVNIPLKTWRPFPTLRSYMERTGANFIDLRNARPSNPEKLFFRNDGHMNAEGHRFVANVIVDWMQKSMPELYRDQDHLLTVSAARDSAAVGEQSH